MFKNQFYVFLQHIFCFPSLLIRNLIVIIPRIKKLNSLLYLGDKSPIYFIIYAGESGSKQNTVFILHKNIQSLHTKLSVDLIWFKKEIQSMQCSAKL